MPEGARRIELDAPSVLVNPQGNFDPADSYLTAHPDFGGQLVYVREVALELAAMGHQADISDPPDRRP